MFTTISKGINRFSTGWVTIIALLIMLVFMVLVLPGQTQKADQYSAATGSPDLSIYYSATDLYEMAEGYGEAGRQAYINSRWTFDLAFPAVYGFFLVTAISWVNRKAFVAGSAWLLTNLLPVGGVLFDLLENGSASIVLARYPAATDLLAQLAGIFTLLKWVFVGGSFVMLVIGLVLWLVNWSRTKKQV